MRTFPCPICDAAVGHHAWCATAIRARQMQRRVEVRGEVFIVVAIVVFVAVAVIQVINLVECWDKGGEYVRGVSLTGYVCLPGVSR